MKFKVGDKVKFLNEKGGGIVSKILGSSMVHVAISEGFDIPVMANELILVDNDSPASRFFDEQSSTEPEIYPETFTEDIPAETEQKLPFDIPQGFYISFVPTNQQLLISGDVEIFLINNTGFDVIYTLFLKDKAGYMGNDYGSIPSFTKTNIQLADREQMEYYTNGVIQLLFFNEFVEEIITPVNNEFKFKAVKLLKEDNYVETSVFNKRAFIYKLGESPLPADEKDKEAQAPLKIPEAQLKRDSMIQKHRIEEGFAEVDLHIEALSSDYARISSHEKLQIQLDYFTRCIESAIADNFERVIFIHGVGAGILKIELKKILVEYPFIEYFDASIAKYGIGATEVLIHRERK